MYFSFVRSERSSRDLADADTAAIIASDQRSEEDTRSLSFRESICRFRISFRFRGINSVNIRFLHSVETILKIAVLLEYQVTWKSLYFRASCNYATPQV